MAVRWKRLCYALRAPILQRATTGDAVNSTSKILVSILLPIYRTPKRFLIKTIKSVVRQSYQKWELIIIDDASKLRLITCLIRRFQKKDTRIKVKYRDINGGISEATNDALAIASGEYIVLIDHDDLIARDALKEIVSVIEKSPNIDFIYTDEDKINEYGYHHSPYLKPDWSPDLILNRMYTCHLGCYRTSILRAIGGFRKEYDGSQDHDMVLRFTEKTQRIAHIQKILYNWRSIPGSTAKSSIEKKYADRASFLAVQSALFRRKEYGTAFSINEYPGYYRVQYPVKAENIITIIIPSKNNIEILDKCLVSICDKTSIKNYEIVIIDNGSDQKEVSTYYRKWMKKKSGKIRIDNQNIPFNFSKLCNKGAEIAQGDLLLFLNNDTEVITPKWLEHMAGFACRESIGAVGAMLLYPDNTIQHAGIVLGVKGIANHHHQGYPVDSAGNNIGQLLSQTNYSAVTGACLMVKKTDFIAVGGFEEELAIAYNDVDLCLKLIKHGKYNVFLPEAKLYHHESLSRGSDLDPINAERLAKESDWMMKKWGDVIKNDPFYNPNLTRIKLDYTPDMRLLDHGRTRR